MKICFFSGDITRGGGTERVSTIIANELVKDEQLNISFLSLFEKKKNTFFDLDENIERYKLFEQEVSGAKHILSYINRIHKFVVRQRINILIDIDGILDMYSIPALWRTKTKLVSWEQFNFYQNPYVNYRKFTRKWAARSADAIVVLTKEDKGYYESNLNIQNIIKQIYNPIVMKKGEKQGRYNTESKEILSVGRLTEQKGFDILVDVARIVLKKHPDWKWNIVGEGEDKEKLRRKIYKYGLEDKVILCGSVKNIDEYYEKSAMYILTSRYEGFGLVLTEAKSHKLPCVSFKCPAGPSEIIQEGINGYLIECFNVEEMADKINVLIERKKLRQEFSERALYNSEQFKLDGIVEQWKKLFGELIVDE